VWKGCRFWRKEEEGEERKKWEAKRGEKQGVTTVTRRGRYTAARAFRDGKMFTGEHSEQRHSPLETLIGNTTTAVSVIS